MIKRQVRDRPLAPAWAKDADRIARRRPQRPARAGTRTGLVIALILAMHDHVHLHPGSGGADAADGVDARDGRARPLRPDGGAVGSGDGPFGVQHARRRDQQAQVHAADREAPEVRPRQADAAHMRRDGGVGDHAHGAEIGELRRVTAIAGPGEVRLQPLFEILHIPSQEAAQHGEGGGVLRGNIEAQCPSFGRQHGAAQPVRDPGEALLPPHGGAVVAQPFAEPVELTRRVRKLDPGAGTQGRDRVHSRGPEMGLVQAGLVVTPQPGRLVYN
ncbi:hypothetical protein ROTAS13_01936 [Roseomonas sp. TAS13]|nr:hypothetical protein ROTAS13_01936 [Roseomonas sp. TAS13]